MTKDNITDDNDMIRPLNDEHAAKLMSFLTERENKAMEEGVN